MVRDEGEDDVPMGAGDHLFFPAGWAHAVANRGMEDLVYYVIADNPANDTCYYPDSKKWSIHGRILRMDETDYFDGEE